MMEAGRITDHTSLRCGDVIENTDTGQRGLVDTVTNHSVKVVFGASDIGFIHESRIRAEYRLVAPAIERFEWCFSHGNAAANGWCMAARYADRGGYRLSTECDIALATRPQRWELGG